ncbi:OmpH family outer membrane protein [Galbibacter sp. EGI 63066]|uniref:OmpH family outer membrane protein n=1 Tax=Galbibacter sp. EGI 63066 TaxID=2993559 RepID=UPI00224991B4|nr:OmpH family outer membrane protein [Galbibacter sp. EGI 63066]MCX2679055.1 OmpH family outer membrane protein [Galbibacter sp. EGI 63066]
MKKIILILAVAAATLSCEQNKIAFVDNSKLINEYQEKIDIEAKYKTKLEKFNKKADSISKIFQEEGQAFQEEAKRLSQSKAQEKYNTLLQKRQSIGQQLQQEEQQLSIESQTEIDSLINKVKDFVNDYAEEKGYTFVLGANDGGSVLYGEESKDITKAVLKALNEKYKK